MNQKLFDQFLSDLKYFVKGLQAYLSSPHMDSPPAIVSPLPANSPALPSNSPVQPHAAVTLEEVLQGHPTGWCQGPLEERKAMYLLAQRVAKEEGLSILKTAEMLATIHGESGYNQYCVSKPNKNGTRDYGVCQFNSGTNNGRAMWIGEGAAFSSNIEVITNPEKCLRVMAREFTIGHEHYWVAYSPTSLAFQRTMQSPQPTT